MGGELYTVYQRQNMYGSETHAQFYVACVVRKPKLHLQRNTTQVFVIFSNVATIAAVIVVIGV